jgi:hypothetical protein
VTKEQLFKWVRTGRELEFNYKGKDYSITYYNDDRKDFISFCEAYDETVDVATVDELWNSTYKGIKLSDMLSSIPEDKVDVF